MIEFIKSIGRWFKREKDTHEQKSYGGIARSEPAYWKNSSFGFADHPDKAITLSWLDHSIVQCKAEMLSAKRRKKKVSHIHKKLEVLVARKLELEGK